jgi:hypothetical protein
VITLRQASASTTNMMAESSFAKSPTCGRDRFLAGESRAPAPMVVEISPLHSLTSRPMRHDQKACPLCGKPIEKTARGGRRKYSCLHCGATINKLLICDGSGTKRVWQGKRERLAAVTVRRTHNSWRKIAISPTTPGWAGQSGDCCW